MKTTPALSCLAASTVISLSLAQTPTDDPFIWLEQAHGARAMLWVLFGIQ
jgi:hypothetical protein